ncbi:MAG: enoyl-CoA hydratase [Betaproteobacteria bacterium]|nr:MAG: enoyl-CoA hydratase [Betaproteobacteria bacterium]
MTEKIIAKKDGAIGWLVFNNPERRNAVSLDMWEAIPKVLGDFAADDAIRVVVLTGAGDKAFVSGADISQFEKQRSTAETVAHYDEVGEKAQTRLKTFEKPVIAMIRGYCIGGGLNIANLCDLRIAADDSRFGIPAAKMGLGYRASSMKNLVDIVGKAAALEIMITARQFSAEEARHMGLVHKVVPVAELEQATREYCDMITANAPLTMGAAKRIIREVSANQYDAAACSAWVKECFDSEDYREGRRAFMEKRKPVFKGR